MHQHKAAHLSKLADRFSGFFGQFLKLYIQTKMSRVVEDEFNQDLSSKVELLVSNISRNLRRYETFGVFFRLNLYLNLFELLFRMGGIIGTAYRCFESYLTGRKQFVVCKGLESDTMGLNYGVPQGLVL